ncbi:hypothetical protein HYW54_00550 [Candidatus Gottesmanbacteria bacterium]|nr:hypothetical protein [Candidatus Gottesmanbacteria bacterium]
MTNKKRLLFPFAIITIILLGGAIIYFGSNSQYKDYRVEIKPAKKVLDLNKKFAFPINDDKGKEITQMKMYFDKVELRDEIIVKGQRALPIKGKTFLVLDIRIRNDYDQALELKARDFVRLSVNKKDDDKLSANIHNDPVTVEPISTKPTRLGFFISEKDENIILYIGELKGDKTKIAVNF